MKSTGRSAPSAPSVSQMAARVAGSRAPAKAICQDADGADGANEGSCRWALHDELRLALFEAFDSNDLMSIQRCRSRSENAGLAKTDADVGRGRYQAAT